MRRHPDELRLATMVRRGEPVEDHLRGGGAGARRASTPRPPAAVRWTPRAEWTRSPRAGRRTSPSSQRYADGVVPGLDPEMVAEIGRLAIDFIAGRSVLFARRIGERKIVDGHADLLADDIFCLRRRSGAAGLPGVRRPPALRRRHRRRRVPGDGSGIPRPPRPGRAVPAQLHPAGRRRRAGLAVRLLHRLSRRRARQGRLRASHAGQCTVRPPMRGVTSRSPATTCAPARSG